MSNILISTIFSEDLKIVTPLTMLMKKLGHSEQSGCFKKIVFFLLASCSYPMNSLDNILETAEKSMSD